MHKITLSAKEMLDVEMTHEYLQEILGLPDYYGKNLDALYDCLCDIEEETLVEIPEIICGDEYLGKYGEKLIAVFEDACDENSLITMEVLD